MAFYVKRWSPRLVDHKNGFYVKRWRQRFATLDTLKIVTKGVKINGMENRPRFDPGIFRVSASGSLLLVRVSLSPPTVPV